MHFVAVAPNPWDGQWMNRQHLMWAVKDHARVLYVQEPEPWHAGRQTRDEHFLRATVEQKAPSLSVLRLPKILCRRGKSGLWNSTVDAWKASLIRREMGEQWHPRVVYFWHPELYRYVELLKPDIAVYHVYDRIAEYYEPRFEAHPLRKAFRRSCELADVVVVGTEAQAEIVPGQNAEIVPNGVPFDWYQGDSLEPDDLKAIPGPRIGYAGTISKKVDFAWFETLASRSRYHLVLVGPLGNLDPDDLDDFKRLCSLSNVHYLGAKPAAVLPAYMKSFDVGLMNYRRGLHCEAGSPLKLYEYAAAGLPMIASRTDALVRDRLTEGLVRFVDSPDEAAVAVDEALGLKNNPEQIARRTTFARENSWQERARRIMDLVVSKLEHSGSRELPSNSQAPATERTECSPRAAETLSR